MNVQWISKNQFLNLICTHSYGLEMYICAYICVYICINTYTHLQISYDGIYSKLNDMQNGKMYDTSITTNKNVAVQYF